MTVLAAQENSYSVKIKKAVDPIVLDGKLDENSWKEAESAHSFYQCFPYDTCYSKTKTEVKLCFDEENLYISAICFDSFPGDFVIQSLKRDFSYPVSDAFAVFIDPFNDKTNGFSFAVNPYGVQREGLIQNGGAFGVTTAWDNKWFSKVEQNQGFWTVEMSIPFKTIRYNPELSTWGINFSRNDLKRNENSSWSPVPRNFNIASTAFTGTLIWEELPKKAGGNVALIPYGTGGYSKNLEAINKPEYWTGNAGLDAKIAVSSSMNLDATLNPDFSQVNVDRQQTNLTRFSLFYPEQRQFFIENSDLFSSFGFSKIRPFFSRMVGLKNGKPVPIIGGVRLSGKPNKKWRVGVMNVQSGRDSINQVGLENYTVAAFQRFIKGRSYISGILVNKENLERMKGEEEHLQFNRIIGLDYNHATDDNKIMGKAFFHKALYPNDPGNSYAHASWAMYNTANLQMHWNHEYVGKNYRADMGFVPRNKLFNSQTGEYIYRTYWRLEPNISYYFYPNSDVINSHGPGAYFSNYYDSTFKSMEYELHAKYEFKFQSSAKLQVKAIENYTLLQFETDVTFSNQLPIPVGDYVYRNVELEYLTNQRKVLSGKLQVSAGQYFNGIKNSQALELSWRTQPWGIFSLNLNRDDISLPEPYSGMTLWLVGPKVELSFTKSLFFTTYFQYNTQMDNVNINSRFQYRFKPMSDLFIVYSENYDTQLQSKNRALVVKLVYWLNL